jgi:hypothetical protein
MREKGVPQGTARINGEQLGAAKYERDYPRRTA